MSAVAVPRCEVEKVRCACCGELKRSIGEVNEGGDWIGMPDPMPARKAEKVNNAPIRPAVQPIFASLAPPHCMSSEEARSIRRVSEISWEIHALVAGLSEEERSRPPIAAFICQGDRAHCADLAALLTLYEADVFVAVEVQSLVERLANDHRGTLEDSYCTVLRVALEAPESDADLAAGLTGSHAAFTQLEYYSRDGSGAVMGGWAPRRYRRHFSGGPHPNEAYFAVLSAEEAAGHIDPQRRRHLKRSSPVILAIPDDCAPERPVDFVYLSGEAVEIATRKFRLAFLRSTSSIPQAPQSRRAKRFEGGS